ncbi:hypothetical protein D3C87_1870120 [compost metagenome]
MPAGRDTLYTPLLLASTVRLSSIICTVAPGIGSSFSSKILPVSRPGVSCLILAVGLVADLGIGNTVICLPIIL